MKHSDESIEASIQKVMAGLRDAGPAVGMEHRILEAVEKRASEHVWARGTAGWWQRSADVFRLAPAKLLLSGFALAMAAILLVSAKIYQDADVFPRSTEAPAPTAATVVQTSPTAPVKIEPSIQQAMSQGNRNQQAPHVLRVKSTRVDAAFANTKADSLALREMHAPSHPAPPLPLTAQEKLLLRVIHKGDPVELAMLDPEVRARQIANSRAEFQKFFEAETSGEAQ